MWSSGLRCLHLVLFAAHFLDILSFEILDLRQQSSSLCKEASVKLSSHLLGTEVVDGFCMFGDVAHRIDEEAFLCVGSGVAAAVNRSSP